MTDLTLGLAIVGGLAVAGVLLYNRLQERSARREAEHAFGSTHSDVLMGDGRREPSIENSGTEPELRRHAAHGVRVPSPNSAAPDPRVDYIMQVVVPQPAAAELGEGWQAIAQRFARRVFLFQSDPGSWQAALQLVSRAGVVAEPELVEFRSEVETLAARLGGSAKGPEMREALQAARDLDSACAEADIQVALHVVGVASEQVFHGHPFQATPRADGVTLTLDVARTPDPARAYEAMARAGRDLAAAQGGRVVDDQDRELDERALASVAVQVDVVRRLLAGRGIEPGSPLALRLFS
jgi:hypothetical protein